MKTSIPFILSCTVTLLASHAQARRVACVGASNTYGYGLDRRESDCYPAQLATRLYMFDRGWEVRNFGVNAACVLKRGLLPYINQSAFYEARAFNPDVVVIQLGGNDSLPDNWVYKDDFLADFLSLIDGFIHLPSQPKIYILYPPPVFPNPWGLDETVIAGQIIPLIAQLPAIRNVHVVDEHSPLKDSRDLFQADGVHFTPAGAKRVAEIVAATIIGMHGTPDFNGDWKVDIQDLILLIEHWGQAEPSLDMAPPPLGDGKVDANDLEAFMSYWGRELNDPTLVAYWKLDEASDTMAADSAGPNNGSLGGDPAWQPTGGKIGGALRLDGVDDCVVTPPVLDPSKGPFSVFAWVQGGAAGEVILSQEAGVNWLMATASSGTLKTELKGTGRFGSPLTSLSVITDGPWHYVGLVWDGKTRFLYVDDAEVGRDTPSNLAASARGLYIGAGSTLAMGTFWSGLIDDVRIYDRAVKP